MFKSLILVLSVLIGAILFAAPSAQAASERDFALTAHRGYHAHTTENSYAALNAAADAGATAMETDLHISRDGVMVVMHNRGVARTTHCRGSVDRLSWRKLKSRRCRLNNGERIPSALTLLRRAHGRGLNVLLEIKAEPQDRWVKGWAQRLATTVAGEGMTNRVRVISFEPDYLAAAHAAGFQTGWIARGLPTPEQAAATADTVRVWSSYLTPEVVKGFTDAGVIVTARETNNSADWQRAVDAGVRSLIADDVPALAAWSQSAGS